MRAFEAPFCLWECDTDTGFCGVELGLDMDLTKQPKYEESSSKF